MHIYHLSLHHSNNVDTGAIEVCNSYSYCNSCNQAQEALKLAYVHTHTHALLKKIVCSVVANKEFNYIAVS